MGFNGIDIYMGVNGVCLMILMVFNQQIREVNQGHGLIWKTQQPKPGFSPTNITHRPRGLPGLQH